MQIKLVWSIWALPFGFSKGSNENDWFWAFSLGPVHLIKHSKEK